MVFEVTFLPFGDTCQIMSGGPWPWGHQACAFIDASKFKNVFVSSQVDAHAEECFFDKVKTGTKMGLMFEVAEGGFLDIDVRIEGPDGKIVHQVDVNLPLNLLIL